MNVTEATDTDMETWRKVSICTPEALSLVRYMQDVSAVNELLATCQDSLSV